MLPPGFTTSMAVLVSAPFWVSCSTALLPATVTSEEPNAEPPAAKASVPLLTVRLPLKVSVAPSVSMPAPDLVRLPAPPMPLVTAVAYPAVLMTPPPVPRLSSGTALELAPPVSSGTLAESASVPPFVKMICA